MDLDSEAYFECQIKEFIIPVLTHALGIANLYYETKNVFIVVISKIYGYFIIFHSSPKLLL